jgi:hypothetical protein
MKNRGVKEAFTEAARVALTIKSPSDREKKLNCCTVM